MTTSGSGSREEQLEQVLADYLCATEQGRPIDREGLLAKHPDLADDLQSFFRNHDAVERIAVPLRAGGTSADEPTLGLGDGETRDPARVRYFGDYELLEEIARGGMGVVYKARQRSLSRLVALKMILAGQLASTSDVERFRQEAEHAANLDHPHIVPIYEIGVHEGSHYFSMKLIEGGNLRSELPRLRGDLLSGVKALAIVARAVHHAHQRGVLHRDLKPGNVLIDKDGAPHVTDFGLAKRVEGDSELTQSGTILGTPSYMAPEQARGERQLSTAVDVYSLGAILYELLTSRPPFQGASPIETLVQVITREAERPSITLRNVDLDLETMALKCLEKDPERRYDSAAALADDLERWLLGEPIVARAVSPGERAWRWCRRNPAVAGLAAAVAASLLLGTCVSLYWAGLATDHARQAEQSAADAQLERERADANAAEARASALQAHQEKDRANNKAAEAKASAEQARREEQRADVEAERARRRLYAAHMNLVQVAWNDATVGRLQQLLDAGRPQETDGTDLRGWEWFFWQRLAKAELLTWSAKPDRMGLRGIAISPDGKHVAVATSHDVVVFDSQTGKSIKTIPSRKLSFNAFSRMFFEHVTYSPDGKWLAACCHGGMFSGKNNQTEYVPGETLLCDAATGKILHTFNHQGGVSAAAFSPTGERLAVGGSAQQYGPGEVLIWDVATRQEVVKLQGQVPNPYKKPEQRLKVAIHGHSVTAVAFGPDGKHLATASSDQTVKLWEVATGMELRTLRGHEGAVTSVAFSPDGERLVTGSADRTAKLWSVATGETLITFEGHRDGLTYLSLSRDGNHLATASSDRTAKVWNMATGEEQATIKGHATGVNCVGFAADGRLATSSSDETVKLWKIESTRESQPLKFGGIGGWSKLGIGFTSDSESLTVAASSVKTWNLNTNEEEKTFEGTGDFRHHPVFSPDGKRLAAYSRSHAIRVWDADSGEEIGVLQGHKDFIAKMVFSTDGNWLATASQDAQIKLWNLASGAAAFTLEGQRGTIQGLAFSADSRFLASAHNTLKIWNVETGEQRKLSSSSPMSCTSVVFSQDGKHLATSDGNKTAQIWDIESGNVRFELSGHIGRVECVAFSPDGRRLATGGGIYDQTVKLWDTTTGQEVISLTGHQRPLAGLAFSPDGHKLASADSDGNIRIWDATPQAEK